MTASGMTPESERTFRMRNIALSSEDSTNLPCFSKSRTVSRIREFFGVKPRSFDHLFFSFGSESDVIRVKSSRRSFSMRDIGLQVKETYNKIGVYFSRSRTFVWPEVRTYLELLKKGDKVLDLGCGNGRLLTGIKTKVEYLGVDFSDTLIDEARRLWPKRRFTLMDLTNETDWKALGKYEAIFCIAVLHHIPDLRKQVIILKQLRKHLKTGGFVYLSVWNLWQPKYWRWHLKSLFFKSLNWRYLFVPFQKKHQRFCFSFDEKYLRKVMRKAGFRKIRLGYADKKGAKSNWLRGCNLYGYARKQPARN